MTEEELQRLEWQIENYGCIFGRDALKLIAIVRNEKKDADASDNEFARSTPLFRMTAKIPKGF